MRRSEWLLLFLVACGRAPEPTPAPPEELPRAVQAAPQQAPADLASLFTSQLPAPEPIARDPFVRAGSTPRPVRVGDAAPVATAPAKLQLQGIFHVGSEQRAMISGRTLRAGEMVSGWRVVAIQARHVTLERDGYTQTLALDR